MQGYIPVRSNEVADYLTKSGSKSEMNGPEPFITVPYTSCVSTVKDWSTDRWKSMWNKRKDCLRMKESVGWTSSRLTMRLLNLKNIGGQVKCKTLASLITSPLTNFTPPFTFDPLFSALINGS